MNTILQAPSISKMIEEDFDLVYAIPREIAITKIEEFKQSNSRWFFSPQKEFVECWYKYLKDGDFEEDVRIAESNW